MSMVTVAAGFFSGVLGAMGLGGGAVLIIYLTLFTETEQLAAQGINLLFFVPIALCAVLIYAKRKILEWRTVVRIAVFGFLGTAIGWYLTGFLGGEITSKLFGGLLVLMGIKEIFSKKSKTVAQSKQKCYTKKN